MMSMFFILLIVMKYYCYYILGNNVYMWWELGVDKYFEKFKLFMKYYFL